MSTPREAPSRLIGGRLALDFLNTAAWDPGGAVLHESLRSLADLDAWRARVALPSAPLPVRIEEAIALRHHLRAVFVPETATAGSDCELEQLVRSVTVRGGGVIDGARKSPLLGLITLSAIAVITDSRELARVKRCPAHDCGWLFLDETRNARRKWCQMETCGNRAKARRHLARQRES